MKISDSLEILFKPTRIGGLELNNRIAMAPMTRAMSPGGVPDENVARPFWVCGLRGWRERSTLAQPDSYPRTHAWPHTDRLSCP